ncbi:hypothetical protein Nmel_005062 [Mimus melanotis]
MDAWVHKIAFLFLQVSGLQVLLALNVQCVNLLFTAKKCFVPLEVQLSQLVAKRKKNAAGLLTAGQKEGVNCMARVCLSKPGLCETELIICHS